jgi:hypothetical protein
MQRALRLSPLAIALFLATSEPTALSAEEAAQPATIAIARSAGPITVDGNLSDPGWQGATKVETWYEVNPGDNTPPKVKNVGYLTFDEKFFYAGFEFEDPQIGKLRAPYVDRDNVFSAVDYGGIIVDTRNDGKTAAMFALKEPSKAEPASCCGWPPRKRPMSTIT